MQLVYYAIGILLMLNIISLILGTIQLTKWRKRNVDPDPATVDGMVLATLTFTCLLVITVLIIMGVIL